MNEVNELASYNPADAQRIKSLWMEAIKKGKEEKKDFDQTGAQLLKYYAKSHEDLVYTDGSTDQGWHARATINKTFEGVKIFGPALYEQNPVRIVTAEAPDDPFVEVLGKYLNYVTRELDRRRHARLSIDEALIKGAGVGWTEVDRHTGLAYTRYCTVDDLILDPDARGIEDIWWMAILCREPLWSFKRTYGETAENVNASVSTGTSDEDQEAKKRGEAKSQDYIVYWRVYSKMGDGLRIRADRDGHPKDDGMGNRMRDYRYLIICPDAELPTFIGAWPTPFWADTLSMGWPCALVDFAREPNRVWPISIFKAGLPIQKWIDWAYSFLLKKVRATCRDIVVMPERLNDKQKAVIRNDAQLDLEVFYAKDELLDDIRKIFQVIQFPQMNGDLLKAIEMAELQFQKVTGLYEILYGQTPQAYRSAQEAIVKDRNSRLRIDDMGREVVCWENINTRHEAICARMHVSAQQIAEMFGPQAAAAWGEYRPGDLQRVVREYQYSIETGSLKPLGPNEMVEQTMVALQTLSPIYGQAGAWGAMNRLIGDWAKYRQIQKPEELMIPLAPLGGQMVPPAQQQAAEAERAAQEAAAKQAELQAAHDKAVEEGLSDAQAMADLKIAQEANATKQSIAALKAQTDLTKVQIQTRAQQIIAASRPKPAAGAKK